MQRAMVPLAAVLLQGLSLALLSGQSDLAGKALGILDANCVLCHGDVRMSDLDLRQRETILQGGKRGPAIVPGKAEESLLYNAVRREGELQMPPGNTPLKPSDIDLLRDWINAGAPSESTTTNTTSSD
jgi:mono/diheme cytochrome c family protein